MTPDIEGVVASLKKGEDEAALASIARVVASSTSADTALAHMLAYTLYAGDLKDWREADRARAAAIALEPEYAMYSEECERAELHLPPRSPCCCQLIALVNRIFEARYRRYQGR
jgi:hypothetical protein